MYRAISSWKYIANLGRVNYVIEDYGEDNVCKSEMYANHCDLSKAEKKKKMFRPFPTAECFELMSGLVLCGLWEVVLLEILLKPVSTS